MTPWITWSIIGSMLINYDWQQHIHLELCRIHTVAWRLITNTSMSCKTVQSLLLLVETHHKFAKGLRVICKLGMTDSRQNCSSVASVCFFFLKFKIKFERLKQVEQNFHMMTSKKTFVAINIIFIFRKDKKVFMF